MHDYDQWVIRFSYCSSKGEKTTRVVSPIRFVGEDRFLALCLSREEPRQFNIGRCRSIELCPAHVSFEQFGTVLDVCRAEHYGHGDIAAAHRSSGFLFRLSRAPAHAAQVE